MFQAIKNLLKKKKKGWYKANYPKTVKEVLDDDATYLPATHEAIRKFKASKPYKGTLEEIKDKFRSLNHDLSVVYEIDEPVLAFVKEFYIGSCYFPIGNLIVLTNEFDDRYSVVTFLHEFGHALHKDEKQTCRWSINLFKRHFPKSFAKLKSKGHVLCKSDSPYLKE